MKFFECPWITKDIQTQCKQHFERLKNGESAEEIAISIYMSLPKNEKIACMMVACIKKMIEDYHANLCLSTEEMVKKKLDEEVDGVSSIEERCKIYHHILLKIAVNEIANSDDEGAQERANDYILENQSFFLPQGEDLVQKEKELRAAVEPALQKSNLSLKRFESCFIDAKVSEEDQKLLAVSAAWGEESTNLKLILCTQIFVNYINGCYDTQGATLSLEEIVNMVCAGVDLNAVAAQPSLVGLFLEKILRLLYCVLVLATFSIIPAMLFVMFTWFMSIPWAIASLIGCLVIFGLADEEYAAILKYVGLRIVEAVSIVFESIYSLFKLACRIVETGVNTVLDMIIRVFSPDSPPPGAGAGCLVNHAAAPITMRDVEKQTEKHTDQDDEYEMPSKEYS